MCAGSYHCLNPSLEFWSSRVPPKVKIVPGENGSHPVPRTPSVTVSDSEPNPPSSGLYVPHIPVPVSLLVSLFTIQLCIYHFLGLCAETGHRLGGPCGSMQHQRLEWNELSREGLRRE